MSLVEVPQTMGFGYGSPSRLRKGAGLKKGWPHLCVPLDMGGHRSQQPRGTGQHESGRQDISHKSACDWKGLVDKGIRGRNSTAQRNQMQQGVSKDWVYLVRSHRERIGQELREAESEPERGRRGDIH